jgi:MinD superfamily P-loop ATPase
MNTAIIIASVAFATMSLHAQAQSAFGTEEKSSIIYQGGKQKYDEKIARAAIDKAASKIGELRGSITGGTADKVIVPAEPTPVKFEKSSAVKPVADQTPVDPAELPPMPMV